MAQVEPFEPGMEPRVGTSHNCDACSSGCTARHTDEKTAEEVGAAPYLLLAAAVVVAVTLVVRWLAGG